MAPLCALACLLAAWTLQLQASPGTERQPSAPDAQPMSPEDWPTGADGLSASPWLDEVRAQRQAWEARRKAAREDFEARRRLNNPLGSARQEAWEEDVRRRRAERQQRIDREREMFRSLGELPPSMPLPESGARGSYSAAEDPLFPPPGWDNLWYFRGF